MNWSKTLVDIQQASKVLLVVQLLVSQSARTKTTLSTKVFDQFIDLTKDLVVEEDDDEPVPTCSI